MLENFQPWTDYKKMIEGQANQVTERVSEKEDVQKSVNKQNKQKVKKLGIRTTRK